MKTILKIALFCLPAAGHAQAPVRYDVSFDNAVHHEARVTITWSDIGDEPLQLRMSRSSPGRYAIHEFAKNVYNVWVVDGNGDRLPATRANPYQWDVAGHGGTVSVTYTIYADRAGGTYSGIDLTHAHLNMPATFMWARGFEDRPISITFFPVDDSWKIATQLVPTDDPYVYTAPNLQYFFDSPTELSNFSLRSWEVESGDDTYTIRLAVHHDGIEEDIDRYTEKAKKIVAEHTRIYGELPPFDFGTYTFIADYLPYVAGDGMEHRNSTVLTSRRSLLESNFGQLGTLSHEFFHAWNVERIRPVDLEPFDFERANMSENLWFAEGFTSYYGDLVMRRAGQMSDTEFADSLTYYVNTVSNSPGRNFASPQGMSRQAPFVDAASAIDPTNFQNVFISYYTYGAAIAVALDLEIRERFAGRSLDSLMRQMWQMHGRNAIPYTNADLREALADVTGDQRFADDFFTRFIEASALPDYAALLANAGFRLQRANPGRATAGPVSLDFEGKTALISDNTIIGTPLYEAGLDRGDEVLAVDRLSINSRQNWNDAIGRYNPGDTAIIRFRQRGVERTSQLTFDEDPSLEVVPFETAGLDVSKAIRDFRRGWLGE